MDDGRPPGHEATRSQATGAPIGQLLAKDRT